VNAKDKSTTETTGLEIMCVVRVTNCFYDYDYDYDHTRFNCIANLTDYINDQWDQLLYKFVVNV